MAYRNIHLSFWTDPKIKKLNVNERYLFLYLITNMHSHPTGLYYLPKTYIANESGLPNRGIDRGIATLIDREIINYDTYTEVIFIKNMMHYQYSNKKFSEQQIKGIVKHLLMLHKSTLISDFLDKYKHLNIPLEYTPIDRGIDRVHDTDTDTDKDSVEDKEEKEKSKKFKKPTIEEIRIYCEERKNKIDPENFFDSNEAKGWLIGKSKIPIKNWKAVVRTWERNDYSNKTIKKERDTYFPTEEACLKENAENSPFPPSPFDEKGNLKDGQ